MSNKDTLLMTIDLGTTFIKASIYDQESNVLASASARVKSECPKPGVFIQRGDDIFDSVINSIKSITIELGEKNVNVGAISFTGQMSGFMGVDKDWNDITTWSCSMDSRYMPYADRQVARLGKEFLEISGTNAPQMAPKFEWFKTEYPEESKKIAKYLMISGYVIGRLGDSPIDDATIDKSYTQWTGLADVRNSVWSDEICSAVGMDKKYLPKIVGSNYICGTLSQKMADITGLKSGIPLVSGAGDKICGCLGSAAVNVGDTVFEASTYGALSACVDEYKPDLESRRIDIVPSSIDGYFFPMNFIIGSGMTLDWFINQFQMNEGDDVAKVFETIEKRAANIAPGCDGLMSIGLLGGSGMPLEGSIKGMWMGFDWSHKVEHFYRAILESYCYDFTLTLRSVEKLHPTYDIDNVKIIGGGAKSDLWTQMMADVMGKTFHRLSRKDVAMWGAAILAGNAIGLFPDIKETARKYVSISKAFNPDMEMHSKYLPYLEQYEQFVRELIPFYKRLQNTSRG